MMSDTTQADDAVDRLKCKETIFLNGFPFSRLFATKLTTHINQRVWNLPSIDSRYSENREEKYRRISETQLVHCCFPRDDAYFHLKMNFNAIAIVFICTFLSAHIECNVINVKPFEHHQTVADQQNNAIVDKKHNENMSAYVKTSIPVRIFQCMQRLSILKCMKIFILQRMERTPTYLNSGNVTADFLDQILAINSTNSDHDSGYENILDKYYSQMPEVEINERLVKCFQRFFHQREIKLHFIPGMVVKVVPGEVNAINLTLKRGTFLFRFKF